MSIVSVFAPARLIQLVTSDARNISRDPTLIFAITLAIFPCIALSIWRDAINAAALSGFGMAHIIDYVIPVILVLPAFLVGWVTGFLLLEDRDDGPLLALDVTPVGKGGFMLYRASVTAFITAEITLLAMALLLPDSGWSIRLLFAMLIAIQSVCSAFILPAVARNKVEGLAVTKLTNIASLLPLIAFIPSPWRYLAGIFPTFWIGEALQLSSIQYLSMPVVLILATLSHVGIAWILYFLINKRVG